MSTSATTRTAAASTADRPAATSARNVSITDLIAAAARPISAASPACAAASDNPNVHIAKNPPATSIPAVHSTKLSISLMISWCASSR